jgi:hypothetical protein
MTRDAAKRASILVGIWAATLGADRPAAITDEAAFNAAITAIRADANNYDKFKEPVATDLIGKSFAITMPLLQEGGEGRGLAYFDYNDGKLLLNVSPSNAWPWREGPGQSMPVLIVSDSSKMTGTYVGQNAYGVTAEVRNFQNVGAGIAIISGPKPMLSPMRAAMNSKYGEDTDWWLTYQLPPSEAKAVGLNTNAVIQGTYANLPSGKPGFCDLGISTATIDSPSNYRSEKCFVGASITRIALVNKTTGAVLKEWTLANAPRLGPELWGGIRVGMNKYDLKAAQPSITSYGYFEANGLKASVEMLKDVAAKVRVNAPGYPTEAVVAALLQRYGQPVASRCITKRVCEGKWRVSEKVVAYLGIGGEVIYQLATDEPPIGFRD